MSDAASDMYREERRERKERDLYMKMMKDEFPRRERVLTTLLKFLEHRTTLNRRKFHTTCRNLTDFNSKLVLTELLSNNESRWASLLYEVNARRDKAAFQLNSPFANQIIGFELDSHNFLSMRVQINISGVAYHRHVDVQKLFNLPDRVKASRWRFPSVF